MASRLDAGEYRFSTAVHQPRSVPLALNSFGIWLILMVGLTVLNYGYPIVQLMALRNTSVPAVYVGAER